MKKTNLISKKRLRQKEEEKIAFNCKKYKEAFIFHERSEKNRLFVDFI
jgi:hypothetical protein